MKIFKEGIKSGPKMFVCAVCTCVFEAEESEYTIISGHGYEESSRFKIQCPSCKEKICGPALPDKIVHKIKKAETDEEIFKIIKEDDINCNEDSSEPKNQFLAPPFMPFQKQTALANCSCDSEFKTCQPYIPDYNSYKQDDGRGAF